MDVWAAPFDEDDVAPPVATGGVAADAFADADLAEAGRAVQGAAGGVLREDAGLDGPDAGGLGGGDQHVQQGPADTPAPCRGVDVHGVFDYTGVHATRGDCGDGDRA